VQFSPPQPGAFNGTWVRTSNAATSPTKVALTGTGVGPQVRVSTTYLDLGDIPIGTSEPIRFEFFWADLPDGVPDLIADHGALLDLLNVRPGSAHAIQ
jgi:hypothetical protein